MITWCHCLKVHRSVELYNMPEFRVTLIACVLEYVIINMIVTCTTSSVWCNRSVEEVELFLDTLENQSISTNLKCTRYMHYSICCLFVCCCFLFLFMEWHSGRSKEDDIIVHSFKNHVLHILLSICLFLSLSPSSLSSLDILKTVRLWGSS